MGFRLLTAPVAEPVTLAEAKAHMRVEHDDDDAKISALISAARQHIENLTQTSIAVQTWRLALDAFPSSEIRIDQTPVIDLVAVSYDDVNGDEQSMQLSDVMLDNMQAPAWVVPIAPGWPVPMEAVNAVRIDFRTGYESNVPEALRQAILMLAAHWYESREAAAERSQTELPFSVTALLYPYRVWI